MKISKKQTKELIGVVLIIYGLLSVAVTLSWFTVDQGTYSFLNPLSPYITSFYENQGNTEVNTMYLGWGFFWVAIGFITWFYAMKEKKQQ